MEFGAHASGPDPAHLLQSGVARGETDVARCCAGLESCAAPPSRSPPPRHSPASSCNGEQPGSGTVPGSGFRFRRVGWRSGPGLFRRTQRRPGIPNCPHIVPSPFSLMDKILPLSCHGTRFPHSQLIIQMASLRQNRAPPRRWGEKCPIAAPSADIPTTSSSPTHTALCCMPTTLPEDRQLGNRQTGGPRQTRRNIYPCNRV